MSMVYRLVALPVFITCWTSILTIASPFWLRVSLDTQNTTTLIGLWQQCSPDHHHCGQLEGPWKSSTWMNALQALECITVSLCIIQLILSIILVFAQKFLPQKEREIKVISKSLCVLLYCSCFIMLLITVIFPSRALGMYSAAPEDNLITSNASTIAQIHVGTSAQIELQWCYWFHLAALCINILSAIPATYIGIHFDTYIKPTFDHDIYAAASDEYIRRHIFSLTPAASITTVTSTANYSTGSALDWGGETDTTSETLV